AAAPAVAGAGPGPPARPRLAYRAPGAARHPGLRGARRRLRPGLAGGLRRPPLHALPGRPVRRPDHPRQGGEDLGLHEEGRRGPVLRLRGDRQPGRLQAVLPRAAGRGAGGRPGEAAHRQRVQARLRAEHGRVPGPGRGVPAVGLSRAGRRRRDASGPPAHLARGARTGGRGTTAEPWQFAPPHSISAVSVSIAPKYGLHVAWSPPERWWSDACAVATAPEVSAAVRTATARADRMRMGFLSG